jgi:RHS repeat-associated protein
VMKFRSRDRNSAGVRPATKVETNRYTAFGENTFTSALGQPFGFTGREYDFETGLYYYRARYYEPKFGRFISEDPIRFDGGMNFYAYVANNPTTFIDPYGLEQLGRDGTKNADYVPWVALPNSRFDSSNQLFGPLFLVPTHGNYCGPYWTGGARTWTNAKGGRMVPVSDTDTLCAKHDDDYAKAGCDASTPSKNCGAVSGPGRSRCEAKAAADKRLVETAKALPVAPTWWERRYREAVVWFFGR